MLDGDTDLVRSLALKPGDMQIFNGRYSLHNFTTLWGPMPRYAVTFSSVEQPDIGGASERTKQLCGRVLPIHLEGPGLRGDSSID